MLPDVAVPELLELARIEPESLLTEGEWLLELVLTEPESLLTEEE